MRVGRRISNGGSIPFILAPSGAVLDWAALPPNDGVPPIVRQAVASGSDADFLQALDPLEAYLGTRPELLQYPDRSSNLRFAPEDVLAPPVRPRNFLCVGLNYLDHARESKMEIPSRPLLFA